MRTASTEYDEFAPRSHTGRYYRYRVTYFKDGMVVGSRRFEKQKQADECCREWENFEDDTDHSNALAALNTGR